MMGRCALTLAVSAIGVFYLFRAEEDSEVEPEEIPNEVFVPSTEWKTVEDHHICPAGLEYRIDLSTGSKLARIPQ
jgi:hypothetical protein